MNPVKFKDSIYYGILKEDLPLIRNGVADLPAHFDETLRFLDSIPPEKLGHAYAPGKWTIAQLIGHLADTQVVFLNRILHIARGQRIEHPGFDEQVWVENGGHDRLGKEALVSMWRNGAALVRSMVEALPEGSMAKEGLANKVEITIEEILLYLMAHEKHHVKVIRERYQVPPTEKRKTLSAPR
jgi:uncharacterized damage-inducible protein DinB